MRIEWNGDTAQSIIRQLSDIEQIMFECVNKTRKIRVDLDDLNPDGDNRRINAIINRYEVTMDRLQRTAKDAEDITDAAKRAAVCFDEAEEQICRLMNSMDIGRRSSRTETGERIAIDAGLRPNILLSENYADWPLPTPQVIPDMRLNIIAPPHAWLHDLLKTIQY